MSRARLRKSAILAGAVVPVALLMAAGPGQAATGAPRNSSGPAGLTKAMSATGESGEDNETQEILDRSAQYAAVRTAPAATVSSEAFRTARAQAAKLPSFGGTWRELTDLPYNSDAVNYRDPFWSNSSAGWGLVSGRMSALATDGALVYAGAGDGGVWRSTDKGQHWTPVSDNQTRLSVGAIAVNPADHSVWVGTGEANTAAENYAGDGIYRSADHGSTWQLVGNRINNSLVSHIEFDGRGHVFVATSRGLLQRSTLDPTGRWNTVLKPDPNETNSPYRGSWMSDVRVRPGSDGQDVIAALGWRGAAADQNLAYNGLYVSNQGGAAGTWRKANTVGIPGPMGRTSLDYAGDGSLYAVVEGPVTLSLKGVYRSANGTAAGPWTLIASNETFANSPHHAPGIDPGNQAWYDQYVEVDPRDSAHVYVGLKEVYESSDAGKTWVTIGPYWNFGKDCHSLDPQQNTCPRTTHPDQHAATVGDDGTAYFGNDGGVYSRPAALRNVVKWTNLNATLHTLQYYYAGIGKQPGTNGDSIYGGLQDNGVSLLKPGAQQMVSPFGGDGGDVIVDPNNADRAVNEYVYLTMARTQNGGRSDGSRRVYTTITPTCASFIGIEYDPQPCDPNPRFIAPFEADPYNINHWVAGGQMIWDNMGKGWNTICTSDDCDWKPVHDLGAGAQTTSIAVTGKTLYAGWCGNGCNPGGSLPFISGLDTNYGGRWHRVTAANLPNRIPTGIYIDPADTGHVYVVYGAFSRRWIPGGGVGHVFESTNGGRSFTNISGNLPDVPANDVLVVDKKIVVGTDIGVFAAGRFAPGSWMRLGSHLPNASTNDLVLSPNQGYLVSATHGRGLWRLDLS